MPRSATVLLVAPSEIVRHGLQEVLGNTVAVIGTASSGKQAIKHIKNLSPAVVLLADRLPDGDGLDIAASILANTKVAVVMVGVEENPTYLARAAAMGVSDNVFGVHLRRRSKRLWLGREWERHLWQLEPSAG
jgi:DNA-binding NarL/FixJ family response regulator